MISPNQPSWSMIMPSTSTSSSTTNTPVSSPSKSQSQSSNQQAQTQRHPGGGQSSSNNNANNNNNIIRSRNHNFQHHDSTFSVSDEYSYYNHNNPNNNKNKGDTNNNGDNSNMNGGRDDGNNNTMGAAAAAAVAGAAVPNLNVWQGAALITADNMGTGLLALPHDVAVLGLSFGLGFLIANLPINLYAGTILCSSAQYVEEEQSRVNNPNDVSNNANNPNNINNTNNPNNYQVRNPLLFFLQPSTPAAGTNNIINKDSGEDEDEKSSLLSKTSSSNTATLESSAAATNNNNGGTFNGGGTFNALLPSSRRSYSSLHSLTEIGDDDDDIDDINDVDADIDVDVDKRIHHDTATFDFIGMTSALFYNPPPSSPHGHRGRSSSSNDPTYWTMFLFYTNIFLVLGNYIVVMAHAVSAMVGEDKLCIPTAGLVASTLMFAVSQLRTMARLGRAASIVSLSALAIVVGQCLYFCRLASEQELDDDYDDAVSGSAVESTIEDLTAPSSSSSSHDTDDNSSATATTTTPVVFFSPNIASILLKLSAMGSIGFAVGSQKLLLNIRHEFHDRSEAPTSLAMSLLVFGACYVCIIVVAGPNPPGFLFDAIPQGSTYRRIGGFLLWVHVVVSYAINSQAICSSMDRIFFYDWTPIKHWSEQRRWMMITGITSASAFFVAMSIPFFKDLVAFIGALTSVPLTLLLPAIYNRKVFGRPIWLPGLDFSWQNIGSYLLLVYATVFMVSAIAGSVYSIVSDWENHTGGFFSCH